MFAVVQGFLMMGWTAFTLGLAVVVAMSVGVAITWCLLATVDVIVKVVSGQPIRLCSSRPLMLLQAVIRETEAYMNEIREDILACALSLGRFIKRLTIRSHAEPSVPVLAKALAQ